MKIKLVFNSGTRETNGHGIEIMPSVQLPDGSAVCLYQHDPACSPRQHKRRAKRLPTLDTRNELGALFAAAPEYKQAAELFEQFLASLPKGWLARTAADIGLLNGAYLTLRAAKEKENGK